MATTIQYPTKNIKAFGDGTVYLRADSGSVTQYMTEQYPGKTLDGYAPEEQRFSNDGALAYVYYGLFTGDLGGGVTGTTTKWQTEFGFSRIVQALTYY